MQRRARCQQGRTRAEPFQPSPISDQRPSLAAVVELREASEESQKAYEAALNELAAETEALDLLAVLCAEEESPADVLAELLFADDDEGDRR